ncbi:hypothetical protein RSOLAG22IIIB_08850 [Rhizoctonia solani]|uniref:Granulins domain-containing protein n=1 Tax=Rhizoctonia solani TaxID=456999 RepID=A0A0K6FV64_9AGAM|nr:hypothetical protein RSOLAG22IIIB_08850 [Rhizoctonia solani]
MKFFSLSAVLAVSLSIVAASPTSDQLRLQSFCSNVGETCNGMHPCCSGLECKGAAFKRTCEYPGAPDCAQEGRPCSDFSNCCAGLTCGGAPFKRSCVREGTNCTPQGSACSDWTTCCDGLTCQGSAFGRTCS